MRDESVEFQRDELALSFPRTSTDPTRPQEHHRSPQAPLDPHSKLQVDEKGVEEEILNSQGPNSATTLSMNSASTE